VDGVWDSGNGGMDQHDRVDPDYQHKGVARKLSQEFIKNVKAIWCECRLYVAVGAIGICSSFHAWDLREG